MKFADTQATCKVHEAFWVLLLVGVQDCLQSLVQYFLSTVVSIGPFSVLFIVQRVQ